MFFANDCCTHSAPTSGNHHTQNMYIDTVTTNRTVQNLMSMSKNLTPFTFKIFLLYLYLFIASRFDIDETPHFRLAMLRPGRPALVDGGPPGACQIAPGASSRGRPGT